MVIAILSRISENEIGAAWKMENERNVKTSSPGAYIHKGNIQQDNRTIKDAVGMRETSVLEHDME